VSHENRAHTGPPPEGARCFECRYWLALKLVGAIAPPVDPQFQARCQALGLDPEERPELAAYGECHGRPPRPSGPASWPMTPALEPGCGAFHPVTKEVNP
jgi:hypothetical protein